MRKILAVVPAVLVLAMMVGCAKPPQPSIDAANAALASAKTAEAADYAADSLKGAEDAVAALQTELKTQEEKFALFRSYKKAEELAASAKAAGEKAAADAAAAKEAAKNAATQGLAELKTALDEAKMALDKAPKGKGTQADLEMMKNDLTGVESAVAEAENALNAGKYKDAQAKIDAAKQTVANTKSAIEQAVAAKMGKK
jgi:hypothetical protein